MLWIRRFPLPEADSQKIEATRCPTAADPEVARVYTSIPHMKLENRFPKVP